MVKGGGLEVGEASTLFRQPVDSYRYDVSLDGQKILRHRLAPEQLGGPQPLTVVLNWPAALKK